MKGEGPSLRGVRSMKSGEGRAKGRKNNDTIILKKNSHFFLTN